MRLTSAILLASIVLSAGVNLCAATSCSRGAAGVPPALRNVIPPAPRTMPLYDGTIPNATAAPDEEKQGSALGWPMFEKVSRPTITAYLHGHG